MVKVLLLMWQSLGVTITIVNLVMLLTMEKSISFYCTEVVPPINDVHPVKLQTECVGSSVNVQSNRIIFTGLDYLRIDYTCDNASGYEVSNPPPPPPPPPKLKT